MELVLSILTNRRSDLPFRAFAPRQRLPGRNAGLAAVCGVSGCPDTRKPFYPHHMDAEWCKTQPFQQRIAHGTLIFSVAVGMTAGNVNSEAFSYGYDRLRFVKPVFIGDTLTATVTVKEKRDSPKSAAHGIVVELCQVFNQRQEAVLACEHLLMVNRRPHGENS